MPRSTLSTSFLVVVTVMFEIVCGVSMVAVQDIQHFHQSQGHVKDGGNHYGHLGPSAQGSALSGEAQRGRRVPT